MLPITSFETIQEAAKTHKLIMDKAKLAALSNPVLVPKWLPFGVTLGSIRLTGCGSQLEMEYVNGKYRIQPHVNPIIENTKFIGSVVIPLSDGTKAIYKEHELFYVLYLRKEGRAYTILMDKIKDVKFEEIQVTDYLCKIASSLAPVK